MNTATRHHPPTDPVQAHPSAALEADLAWLEAVLGARLRERPATDPRQDSSSASATTKAASIAIPAPAVHPAESSVYANFLHHYELDPAERLTVLLALAPHVRPELLDVLFTRNQVLDRGHSKFGGIQGRSHGGFLPTGETALFLVGGDDLQLRLQYQQMFEREHLFASHEILRLDSVAYGEPRLSGQLVLSDDFVDLLTRGAIRQPDFSRDFPARLLETQLSWDDLVLAPSTREEIRELEAWIQHEAELMQDWQMAGTLRPGYRCLFYGPPGTGKTLTASLLGQRFGRDVYRVALSSVVSKYIGETEKNLERIFNRAENLQCILFFDEADALFGKRTTVADAHDRYANQEVSYLLQRVEEFSGVAVLATNFRNNLDEAFTRRFQALIHFPLPGVAERLQLWRNAIPAAVELEPVDILERLSKDYELSGGSIMNIVRYALLMTLQAKSATVHERDLLAGIRRELLKEGKTL